MGSCIAWVIVFIIIPRNRPSKAAENLGQICSPARIQKLVVLNTIRDMIKGRVVDGNRA